MKITDFAIAFLLIFICIAVPIDLKVATLGAIESKKVTYNNCLDNAVDDAVISLMDYEEGSHSSFTLNKELCVQQFFKSLAAGFAMSDQQSFQTLMDTYIPIILITDEDGFYLRYKHTYLDSDSEVNLISTWTEKKPYSYEEERYIISFTFSDYLKIYDKWSNTYEEGYYSDLRENYVDSQIYERKSYEEIRQNSIVFSIEDAMKDYINHYNGIARQFGITYRFYLPATSRDELERTIDHIGMFVLFQGYPYGLGTSDTYNRYAYGASRLYKKRISNLSLG